MGGQPGEGLDRPAGLVVTAWRDTRQGWESMTDDPQRPMPQQIRSTQKYFTGLDAYASPEDELRYYKEEYARLKAIIALQKQKIRKLVGEKRG